MSYERRDDAASLDLCQPSSCIPSTYYYLVSPLPLMYICKTHNNIMVLRYTNTFYLMQLYNLQIRNYIFIFWSVTSWNKSHKNTCRSHVVPHIHVGAVSKCFITGFAIVNKAVNEKSIGNQYKFHPRSDYTMGRGLWWGHKSNCAFMKPLYYKGMVAHGFLVQNLN